MHFRGGLLGRTCRVIVFRHLARHWEHEIGMLFCGCEEVAECRGREGEVDGGGV